MIGAAGDRQPRLVLRFALVTGLGLALAGALILAAVREIDQRQAVDAAAERTRFVAETFLRSTLRPSDVRSPVDGRRRDALDAQMRRSVMIDGAIRVSVVGAGNRITYSTDHRLIGRVATDDGSLTEARVGSLVSRTTDVAAPTGTGTTRALVSSVPIVVAGGAVAVVTIEQDFVPIAAAAHEALLPVAAVLELALVFLFVLLLPALRRATRKLHAYVEEIRYRSRHDVLTGLANRDALSEDLGRALSDQQPAGCVAVLLIDLDRFKEVNDSLGHDAGDELLIDIARRLAETAGAHTVYRLGGDEFAVVLADTTPGAAVETGHALRRAIEAPAAVRGIPVSVDASVGVALCPDDGNDVSQLIRRADVAMYVAKRTRAGVLRYDADTDRNDADKLVLMTELRVAVERGELEVHYQPIVTASTGMLAKAEALVRWRHPVRGMLSPGAFIPLAEHTRLVVDLNRFVLQESLRQCGQWRRRGAEFGITVNVTVLDLLERTFPRTVAEALADAGFPSHALTIEITEGALVQEPERVRQTLDELRGFGVKVAIDDFGTGYSSLSYLKDLPVDVLKLDRSFISDLCASPASEAIVAAAIELSHGLGLEVVAEGVETDEQYDRLERLGCDLIQGYFISAPVSAAEMTARIAALSVEAEAA